MQAKNFAEDVWWSEFFPGAERGTLFDSSALPRSKLYFLNMLMYCKAASPVSSKLNSGGIGVLQGVCMTSRIWLIKLLGQSKVETIGML